MDPLPLASTAWPTLQTCLLVSQTILLLTFLAIHHSQPQPQNLHAIPDAVATATAPSTQALVSKAQHLVAELNILLVSIDTHHEAILQLRRQIQLVDQRISNPTSMQSSASPVAVHAKLRNPQAEEMSEDGARTPRRQPGGSNRREGPLGTGNLGDDGGSEDSEDTAPKPERHRNRGRD